MTADVATVGPGTLLAEAARLMRERRVSGLPVVDAGRLAGVITEGDMLRQLHRVDVPGYIDILGGVFPIPGSGHLERQLREITAYRVDQLMTRNVVTAAPDEDVAEAARRMERRRVRRLPVLDGTGRLVGIVTRSDLLRAVFS